MYINVDWYLPDKVLLMTCSKIIEINDLVKNLNKVATEVGKSSAERVYLIVDAREVRKIPGLIELLSIKMAKQSKFEDIVIVGLKNGLLRMPIMQAMRSANQQCYFVKQLRDAEKLIDSKEQFLHNFPLISGDEDETVQLKKPTACR